MRSYLSRIGSSLAIEKRALPLYLMTFFVSLGTAIVAPVLPELKEHFGISYGETSLIVAAYPLTRWVVDLPVGFVADKISKSSFLAFGTVLLVLGSVFAGLSASYPQILASRVTMGMGSSIVITVAMIYLTQISGLHNRGRILSLYNMASLTGSTFSPAIGGIIASIVDWRAAFYFCAITAFFSLVSVLLTKPGAAEIGVAAKDGRAGRQPGGAKPSPEMAAWSPAMLCLFAATAVVYFSRAGFKQAIIPFYGKTVLGLDTSVIGLILSLTSIVMALSMLPTGGLIDRFGRKVVFTPGTLLVVAGMLSFIFATDVWQFAGAAVLFSAGAMNQSVPPILIADLSSAKALSRNIGLFRFVADFSIFAGPVLLSALLDFYGFEVPILLTVGITLLVTLLFNLLVAADAPRRLERSGPGQQ